MCLKIRTNFTRTVNKHARLRVVVAIRRASPLRIVVELGETMTGDLRIYRPGDVSQKIVRENLEVSNVPLR